jgi:DnaJ-class molecular chaperone
MSTWVICPVCKGSGEVYDVSIECADDCETCYGLGEVEEKGE